MKKLAQLVLAGIVGGCFAFGAFKFFDKNTVIYEQIPAQRYDTSVSSSGTADISTNFIRAAEKANPAVVHIKAQNKAYVNYQQGRNSYDPLEDFWGLRRRSTREQPQAGTGSGVLISRDGYIVTNNHVVGFADYLEVVMEDGQTYEAQKIGTDPSTDLAVIKIEGEGKNLPYLDFSDSDRLKVGEWVVAVGNPFNLTSTVTAGIISAMGRDLDIIQNQKSIEEFIQTDAVVNPGNSGGALVNTNGDLIGINTAISSPTGVYAGYSFAIPSNLVKRVVEEIMETGGDIQRALLGINIASVEAAKEQGISLKNVSQGVYVADYLVDRYGRKMGYSSAEAAGVEKGDVIIGVNGNNVAGPEDLQEELKFAKIGDTVSLTVMRDGKQQTIPVKLRRGI